MSDAKKRRGLSWLVVSIISALMALAFLAFVFIPNFINYPDYKWNAERACISNLKSIEGAKSTWASENFRKPNAVPSDANLYGDLNYIRQKPACPSGGTYTLGSVGEKPRCSIPGHTI